MNENRHNEFSKEDNIITDYVSSGDGGFITEVSEMTESPAVIDVIGVKFKDNGKVYYFDPKGITVDAGMNVIVETARGVEFGAVAFGNKTVPSAEVVPPLRPVIRIATEEDAKRRQAITEKEKEAYSVCFDMINEHGLGMKLIDAEYTFDESKLIFHFSADGRVDFRELVKDLAASFRTRIELRQIGIRDEAKILGGLGVCGRPFCCTTFLSDFVQVSIKMAKDQSMSLNSSKISGTCGRLMCCLKYEHDAYTAEAKITPSVGSRVSTPEGNGTVKEVYLIAGKLKVLMDSSPDTVKEFKRDDVKQIPKTDIPDKQPVKESPEQADENPPKKNNKKHYYHKNKKPKDSE